MRRRLFGFDRQLLQRRRFAADRGAAVHRLDGLAAGSQVEQRDGAFVRRHLRVIAALHEPVAGQAGQFGGLARLRDLLDEDVAGERLGRRIRRVVHDETVRAEHCFDPVAERLRHASARLVGAAQSFDDFGAELGIGQRGSEFVDGGGDLVGERQPGDGTLPGPRRVWESHGVRGQFGVEHRTPGHFRPVVVFGVDPEHGHDRHTVVALDLGRELHRGEGLEQGEERAAEQPGLLAGNHHARGGIGKAGGGSPGFSRGAAPGLLIRQHGRQVCGAARRGLRAADGIGPGGRCGRIAREKWLDAREVVRVVGSQAANPGKLSYVNSQHTGGRGCRRVGRHRRVLSQSVAKCVNSA